MSFPSALKACEVLTTFMGQRCFVTLEQIRQQRQLQNQIMKEKSAALKQPTLLELFKKTSKESKNGMLHFFFHN